MKKDPLDFLDEPNENMIAALEYIKQGFSIMPIIPETKKPYVKWKPYQKELPSEKQIKEWWTKWPDALIGMITGEISGITIVDCDSPEAIELVESYLPESLTLPISGTKNGRHYFFLRQLLLKTLAGVLPNVDVRNDGG